MMRGERPSPALITTTWTRPSKTERYYDVAGDGVDADSDPNPDDRLIARSETFYDDRGRSYMRKTYAVDPSDGTVGSALVGYSWYDAAGNVIKQQAAGARSFAKTQYDGLGRAMKQLVGYDLGEIPGCVLSSSSSSSSSSSGAAESYTAATNVDGDTILEQTETTLDEAGHAILSTSRQRRHDATGTGELTTMSGSQPQARVSYVAMYADPIGRPIATANYGTNGDAALSRSSTRAGRSDTVLVTTTEYNSAGQAYQTIDPAGREDRQEFDDAGRVTKTIQNYQDGTVDGDYPDEDVTVEMTYTADGQILTLTAKNPSTGDQTTHVRVRYDVRLTRWWRGATCCGPKSTPIATTWPIRWAMEPMACMTAWSTRITVKESGPRRRTRTAPCTPTSSTLWAACCTTR